MKTIIGAGMAGLIAGHAWPQAEILEAAPAPREMHKALLRFRSDAVSRLTGIEFRRVRVHKGIYSSGEFHQPNIRLANKYAQKVLGFERIAGDRSIWNIEAVDRFIAPEDFYERLMETVQRRVTYNVAHGFSMAGFKINTAPLPVALNECNVEHDVQFHKASIRVRRWRIPHADVFQTVYFPDLYHTLYRASITKDMLIAEFSDDTEDEEDWMEDLCRAFGVRFDECAEPLEDVHQKYGKIEPINDSIRKDLLFKLTNEHKIFSLGRFATWRNILLDDLTNDIDVIKRIVRNYAPYEMHKAMQ